MDFKTKKSLLWFSKIWVRETKTMEVVFDFDDRYIQLKDKEFVDSENLKGDRVRYIQVNLTVNIRHDFREVVG